MIVAVTGGTGFIGARLVETHLSRGDEVRVLSRRPLAPRERKTTIVGDLATGEVPREFFRNADVLYHCAGEVQDPGRMHEVHVRGTRRLIDRVTGFVGRWIQLSSVGVYGPRRRGVITEETPEAPVGTYEVTKAESDCLVRAAHERGDLDAVILRPSIVFGPDMRNKSLFALFSAVERGMFFFIGPRGASANYIPVENVIDALLLCGTIKEAAGETFNVSDHRSMETFIATIASALGRPAPTRRLPRSITLAVAVSTAFIPRSPLTRSRVDALSSRAVYSNSRIESRLGFHPRVSVEDALVRMVDKWRGA